MVNSISNILNQQSVLGLFSKEDSAADALDALSEAGFEPTEYEI